MILHPAAAIRVPSAEAFAERAPKHRIRVGRLLAVLAGASAARLATYRGRRVRRLAGTQPG